MKKFIGVDIGGTYSRFGVVNSDGKIERMIKIHSGGEESLTPQTIASAIFKLMKGECISGVGVGVPGVVLPNGKITLTTNLKQLEGIGLKEYLENILLCLPPLRTISSHFEIENEIVVSCIIMILNNHL